MITKHVVVLPYDEHWTRDFCEIKSEIQEALDQLALVIEHVGSTSVHGLSAKLIIDIDVVIKDYSMLDAVISALERIDYHHEGNLGIAGREAFKYEGKTHLRKHHLYVCPRDSEELKSILLSVNICVLIRKLCVNTVELKKKALHSIHLILRSISSISHRLSKKSTQK